MLEIGNTASIYIKIIYIMYNETSELLSVRASIAVVGVFVFT